MDNFLVIERAEPFKVSIDIKIASFFKTKQILKCCKEQPKDDDKDFKETLLIDEVLEAENNG